MEEEKLLKTEKRLEEARKRLQASKLQEVIEIEDCVPHEINGVCDCVNLFFF